MQIQLTARHFSAPQSLRDYATAKLNKLEKFYDQVMNVHVVFEHLRFTSNNSVEITLHVSRQVLTAKATAEKHTDAIDVCIDQLRTQLLRYKEKVRYKRRAKFSDDDVLVEITEFEED